MTTFIAIMSLSQNLVAARKKKGLTQENLAELTNITVRTIQRIESGETVPRPYTLKTIAAALDTTFEALQSTEAVPPRSDTPALHDNKDAGNFLQLLCLSCFSYIVVPFVHFLIPMYLLKKRKEQNPQVLAYARRVIRNQVYWVIAFNLLLLLTVAYNILCATYLDASYYLNYLIPLFAMYLVNAFIISMATIRSKAVAAIDNQ
jgi:XRE family transcriptional regulator, regulator of sulfur utilization